MPRIQMNHVRKLDTLIYVLSNGGGDLTANVNTEVKLCNGKGTVWERACSLQVTLGQGDLASGEPAPIDCRNVERASKRNCFNLGQTNKGSAIRRLITTVCESITKHLATHEYDVCLCHICLLLPSECCQGVVHCSYIKQTHCRKSVFLEGG